MRYIRGKFATAACNLQQQLSLQGVRAMVGYESNHRKKVLTAYVDDAADIPKIPKQFGEFTVTAEMRTEINYAIHEEAEKVRARRK